MSHITPAAKQAKKPKKRGLEVFDDGDYRLLPPTDSMPRIEWLKCRQRLAEVRDLRATSGRAARQERKYRRPFEFQKFTSQRFNAVTCFLSLNGA